MSLGAATLIEPPTDTAGPSPHVAVKTAQALREYFDARFDIWDASTSQVIYRSEGPPGDELALAALVRVVAERGQPEIVAEAGSVCLLAIPLAPDENTRWVATAPLVVGTAPGGDCREAARLLGICEQDCRTWLAEQEPWSQRPLLKLAAAVTEKLQAEAAARKLAKEVELVSENLASTYEEISLVYAVTQNLRISSTDEELGRLAIDWLGECLPAESFAIMYLPLGDSEKTTFKSRPKSKFITSGECPLTESEFTRMIETLDIDPAGGPYVCNDRVTASPEWNFPGVRQLIAVPLVEGENVFGYLAVFNHSDGESFGTVEANLIGSLGTLLGTHCGNRELYRQQSELLADMVRALVSAIDAKDPYTSGHSDRVARFAVRIALEMRCGPKFVNTIYMAGLLHDIGKIGIDDNVLRKAGRLTEQEFEHIKKHPELGYRILADLKPLADVLPAVLHHHEQWDGHGYPLGLSRSDIPLIARILAVADAYDAMTSDRPYRRGMPEEKVYQIFREGAAQHWDPDVVEAFFRAKDDIRRIGQRDRPRLESLQQQLV
jgi:hypothetical protein